MSGSASRRIPRQGSTEKDGILRSKHFLSSSLSRATWGGRAQGQDGGREISRIRPPSVEKPGLRAKRMLGNIGTGTVGGQARVHLPARLLVRGEGARSISAPPAQYWAARSRAGSFRQDVVQSRPRSLCRARRTGRGQGRSPRGSSPSPLVSRVSSSSQFCHASNKAGGTVNSALTRATSPRHAWRTCSGIKPPYPRPPPHPEGAGRPAGIPDGRLSPD